MARRALRWAAVLGVAVLGAAPIGGCDAGDEPVVDRHLPLDPSPAALLDFVDDRVYEGEGWRAETDAPRPESTSVSPHDRVQVFQNETLITSRMGDTYAVDSVAVKVIYEGDAAVGHAVMWKVPDTAGFTYFCYGPRGRCGYAEQAHSRDEPIFGVGLSVVCGQCHGGLIFTEITP